MFNTFYIDPSSDLKILSEPSNGYLDYFKVDTTLTIKDIQSIFQDYLEFRCCLLAARWGCCAEKSYEEVVLSRLQCKGILSFILVERFSD
jgi:hypothetical protein